MKSTKQMAVALPLLCVTFATVIGVAGSQQREASQSSPQPGPAVGLREAAAATGSYVGRIAIRDDGAPTSLSGLVDESELIVVGRIVTNVSRLTRDGLSIVIAYDVVVESSLKGAGRSPAMITVLVPGGRVSFEDGSWAELRAPGFLWPMDGSRYVWFLKRGNGIIPRDKEIAHTTDGMYIPAFGPLGVYELKGDAATVRPAGLYRTPLGRSIVRARKYEAGFLSDVREAVANRQASR